MTQYCSSGLSDAQLRDALLRQPDASHLRDELDLVVASVGRTRQVRLSAARLALIAAAAAILLLLFLLALIGSTRLRGPGSGLVAIDVSWDIVLVHGDGSDPRWLTRDADTEWEPAWSPDGKRLAYWLEDPLPQGGTCGVCGVTAPRRLVVTEVGRVASPRVLTTVSNNSAWRIAWSPDGRRLVVGDRVNGVRVLQMIDVDSGVETQLGPASLDGWDPAWSPEGRHIAFAHGADDPSQRALEVIDPDGSNLRQVSTVASAGAGFSVPVWSPVDERIAFAAETAGADRFQKDIWTVGLDGSPQVDRSNDPADELGVNWSPDGTRLAWLREVQGTSGYHVVIANADGSEASVLPLLVSASPPIWSPDATRVLAVELITAAGAGAGRLVAIDVTSGASVVVMDAVPNDIGSWQPPQP